MTKQNNAVGGNEAIVSDADGARRDDGTGTL